MKIHSQLRGGERTRGGAVAMKPLRVLLWLSVGVAVLLGLLALVHGVEWFRGRNAWENFKREWEAKGVRFDITNFVPPAVPDSDNFALAPIIAELCRIDREKSVSAELVGREAIARVKALMSIDFKPPEEAVGDWRVGRVSELSKWREHFRALAQTNNLFAVSSYTQAPCADVVAVLSVFDPVAEELRKASGRRFSRFPVQYDSEDPASIWLPHLPVLKFFATFSQLRAIAKVKNGQTDEALEEVKVMMWLMDSVKDEPFLSSHLVRIAILRLVLQPVWEGLAEGRWSEAQLEELDRLFKDLDFLEDYQKVMRGELAFTLKMFDYRRGHPEAFEELCSLGSDGQSDRIWTLFLRFMPVGWVYQNQVWYARFHLECLVPVVDLKERRVSFDVIDRAGKKIAEPTTPYNFLGKLVAPNEAPKRFAFADASVALVRTALALERYRLKRGAYPESLSELVPQYFSWVPTDVITGEPLKYKRSSPDQFVLYSVGWNRQDDGGRPGLGRSNVYSLESGDWVWQYPR